MTRRGPTLRSAALIAVAALAVHQLRYLLAYGPAAHQQLAHQGHSYLATTLPVLLGFAVAALAAGLLRAARRGPATAIAASPRRAALLYGFSIALVFCAQESAEGMLSAGHGSGLAAVLAGGGWLAFPLAVGFGALCALLDGGLVNLESLIAGGRSEPDRLRAPRRPEAPRSVALTILASLPLAFGISRRPPPLGA